MAKEDLDVESGPFKDGLSREESEALTQDTNFYITYMGVQRGVENRLTEMVVGVVGAAGLSAAYFIRLGSLEEELDLYGDDIKNMKHNYRKTALPHSHKATPSLGSPECVPPLCPPLASHECTSPSLASRPECTPLMLRRLLRELGIVEANYPAENTPFVDGDEVGKSSAKRARNSVRKLEL
ncbi:hypothetical protein COLO4_04775 [Corchorus olitorius]|uniref:Uncharacterized protein n=1 Tax=Corchorus olitorius TaxID=93759 RepID=A0A1R3KSX5_9ROSI|nr:hypothetical protein COLO4_04775 [Corchorus olitorius]